MKPFTTINHKRAIQLAIVLLLTLLLIIIISPTVFAQPGINWVKGIEGQNIFDASNNSNAIKTDANGNVFIAGYFAGTLDFDPGNGTVNLTSQGTYSDLFIAKYAPDGSYVWAKQIRTNDHYPVYEATSVNMAINSAGDIFLTGRFDGVQDFNPDSGSDSLRTVDGYGMFVLKMDNNGNYQWGKAISADAQAVITLDNTGNIYLGGYYRGTPDFNPGAGVDSLPFGIYLDIFMAKYDAGGNFLWVKGIHSGSNELINDIVSDNNGNIYVCGNFESPQLDFDPDAGTETRYRQSLGIGTDFFIAKYSSTGSFVWANTYGSPTFINPANTADRIRLTSTNDVIVTGGMGGEVDFNADTPIDTLGFESHSIGVPLYFAKYDGATGNYIFARALFGHPVNYTRGLGLDGAGNIFVASNFEQVCDADPGPSADTISANGRAIFLAAYSPTGNYMWAGLISSGFTDQISNIHVLANGTLFITGRMQLTTDFDLTAGADSLVTNPNSFTFYVAKYGAAATSVNELKTDFQNIMIWPNPFANTLSISAEITDIKNVLVTDAWGRKVYEGQPDGNNFNIRTDSWANGIYFIHLKNDKETQTKRVVKE